MDVGLEGVGSCEALERSESYHRCLDGLDPALTLTLVAGAAASAALRFKLVVVHRALRPLRLPLTERSVSRYEDIEVLSDPGVAFSQAEQPTRPGGVVGNGIDDMDVGGEYFSYYNYNTKKEEGKPCDDGWLVGW